MSGEKKRKYLFVEMNEGMPVTLTFGHGRNDQMVVNYGMTIELTEAQVRMVPAKFIELVPEEKEEKNVKGKDAGKVEDDKTKDEGAIKTKDDYDKELMSKTLKDLNYADLLQLRKDKYDKIDESFKTLKKANAIIEKMLSPKHYALTKYNVALLIDDSGLEQ